MTSSEPSRAHGLQIMSGRDPYEQHRVATPLELLYDLTFAVAFAVAGEQFAHLLAEGHFAPQIEALLGTPVYLDLRVKVVKEWQRDSKQLNRLLLLVGPSRTRRGEIRQQPPADELGIEQVHAVHRGDRLRQQ